MEGGVFKVLMIPTLVVETVISQSFVLTQVSNFIANFVLKTDRQTDRQTDRHKQSAVHCSGCLLTVNIQYDRKS